eukprot:m.203815 g.203815  ORF g.203815 m.203815 type:complete len:584 (+) comp32864_c1_seq4:67-1818(+)
MSRLQDRVVGVACLFLILGTCYGQNDACETSTDATQFLNGVRIRVALYSGELSACDSQSGKCKPFDIVTQEENAVTPIWTGYDLDLLQRLSTEGNFTYDIISMGSAQEISSSVGYTTRAQEVLGVLPSPLTSPADVIGQGTWRVNADRATWAIWSVPVISEDVWLLTKGPQLVEDSTLDKILLVFSPFTWNVWVLLFGTLVFCTVVFAVVGQKWKGTVHEITTCGIFYHMAVNCTGREAIDVEKAHLKGISIGWIFFIFVIAEVYVANLTAILSKPQTYAVTYSNIQQVVDAQATFCVQKNAANDAYFSSNPKWKDRLQYSLTNETRMSSVPEQIDAVVDGRCDSAEITREDFYAWQKTRTADVKCIPKLSDVTLTRRARGMMTTANNTCVLASINTLYHAITVKRCSGLGALLLCDADDFHAKWFPQTICRSDFESQFDIDPLDGVDLLGAYFILFAFTFLGAVASCFGSLNRKMHIPILSRLMESAPASVAREMEKITEQRETETMVKTLEEQNKSFRKTSKTMMVQMLNSGDLERNVEAETAVVDESPLKASSTLYLQEDQQQRQPEPHNVQLVITQQPM